MEKKKSEQNKTNVYYFKFFVGVFLIYKTPKIELIRKSKNDVEKTKNSGNEIRTRLNEI